MSSDDSGQKPRLWAFRSSEGVVGVLAPSEAAAALALAEGSATPVRLKSTPPLPPPDHPDAVVALGRIDDSTTLVPDFRPHDLSLITLEDESGARWALRPNMRHLQENHGEGDER